MHRSCPWSFAVVAPVSITAVVVSHPRRLDLGGVTSRGVEWNVERDDTFVVRCRYDFKQIASLNAAAPDSTVDVIGVINKVEDIYDFTSKAGKPVSQWVGLSGMLRALSSAARTPRGCEAFMLPSRQPGVFSTCRVGLWFCPTGTRAQLTKRTITIVDDSCSDVSVTLWG